MSITRTVGHIFEYKSQHWFTVNMKEIKRSKEIVAGR